MKAAYRFTITLALLMFASLSFCQGTPKSPTEALRHYIELRLQWADWTEYSQLVAWPDEPGWDCWWVAKHYSIGTAERRNGHAVIPVTFGRLGLYCENLTFEPERKADNTRYEMVRQRGRWKVNGPIPDYPYVGWEAVGDVLRDKIAKGKDVEQQQTAQQALRALLESSKE